MYRHFSRFRGAVTRTVIETVRWYLRVVHENGIPVSFGVLYGSQARGTAREDSDIDLLVVSPHFDGKKDFDEVGTLWRLTARTDYRLEPIPVGEREWKEDYSRAIVEIARREGKIVEL